MSTCHREKRENSDEWSVAVSPLWKWTQSKEWSKFRIPISVLFHVSENKYTQLGVTYWYCNCTPDEGESGRCKSNGTFAIAFCGVGNCLVSRAGKASTESISRWFWKKGGLVRPWQWCVSPGSVSAASSADRTPLYRLLSIKTRTHLLPQVQYTVAVKKSVSFAYQSPNAQSESNTDKSSAPASRKSKAIP